MRERNKKADRHIGLLGGSFDPVHIGHLAMAERALRDYAFDRLMFVPAADSPFKQGKMHASAQTRLSLLEAAVAGNPRFGIETEDIDRGGVSYTVELVERLQVKYGQDTRLTFIIGADSLLSLHKWHRATELVRMCAFASYGRSGTSIDKDALGFDEATNARLAAEFHADFDVDVSSTRIRDALALGQDVSALLPPAVLAAIREKGLYAGKYNLKS